MDTFRDPFNVLTVANAVGTIGIATWVGMSLKYDEEDRKMLRNDLEKINESLKEIREFMNKSKNNFILLNDHYGKIMKEYKAMQRRMDTLNLETSWTVEALKKIEKHEKTKDRDFKLPKKSKAKSKKSKYESDSDSDSESDGTGSGSGSEGEPEYKRKQKEEKDDEPRMRRRRR